jgi:hypothetical protein
VAEVRVVLGSWEEDATSDIQGITKRTNVKGSPDTRVLRTSDGRLLCRHKFSYAAVECVSCVQDSGRFFMNLLTCPQQNHARDFRHRCWRDLYFGRKQQLGIDLDSGRFWQVKKAMSPWVRSTAFLVLSARPLVDLLTSI